MGHHSAGLPLNKQQQKFSVATFWKCNQLLQLFTDSIYTMHDQTLGHTFHYTMTLNDGEYEKPTALVSA